ncbi:hypothetical protein I316_00855 [Kwoniella heveanensis BCC8398]|uniref:Uncharacterized protein n=1 Tax=Kwoniella heveanensis BCC8398 TaxID=1296120 RepID=A0A1B9H379_9TREE|nr:hypothetical protein I316_00855 [Kwoniella heveanensis BCC8398]
MSASISWGLSSISCTSPSTPPFTPMSRKGSEQIQDDVAVQALSKQFTPGKRRVLESFTVHSGDELSQNQAIDSSMTVDKSMDAAGMGMHKRRMRSEVEVDSIVLGRCDSIKGRSRVQAHEVLVDDEEMVEDLVDVSPSHLQQQHSNDVWDKREEVEDDLDEIDSHLHLDKRPSEIRSRVGSLTPSPATSSTSSFKLQPSTPSKSSCMDYNVGIKKHSPLAPSHGDGDYDQHKEMSEKEKLRDGGDSKVEVNNTDIGLERTCSRFSERSCETVKQQVWGRNDEITPKAARVRRLTSSSCKA